MLTRLGIKITTKPSECTHLIAPHLVRTEKFLCALAVAPYILSENWALESAAAKKILRAPLLVSSEHHTDHVLFFPAEESYLLRDKANERRFNFKLGDALTRAKELNGKLFAGQTFYVTPKVPVETKLLKNVVTACGGQVRRFLCLRPASRNLTLLFP